MTTVVLEEADSMLEDEMTSIPAMDEALCMSTALMTGSE